MFAPLFFFFSKKHARFLKVRFARTTAETLSATPQQGGLRRQRTAPSTPVIDARDPADQLWETLRIGVAAADTCGPRAFMEDTHFVIADIDAWANPERERERDRETTRQRPAYSAFAVMDGHSGDRAAQYVARQLPSRIAERLDATPDDVPGALTAAFDVTDRGLTEQANAGTVTWKDGCTAIVVLLAGKAELWVANVGDCRAVLAMDQPQPPAAATIAPTLSSLGDEPIVTPEPVASLSIDATAPLPPAPTPPLTNLALSKDHVASDPAERARIEKAGGAVVNGRVMGVMEVSRSFGDTRFKTSGVTSIPDVVHHVVAPADRFLVIASDGVWKVMDNTSVVSFVQRALLSLSSSQTSQPDLHSVAHSLVQEALRLGTKDNVTVILVVF
jgi:integrin-linked kinase-associated serine/threonine phosphatase 2C